MVGGGQDTPISYPPPFSPPPPPPPRFPCSTKQCALLAMPPWISRDCFHTLIFCCYTTKIPGLDVGAHGLVGSAPWRILHSYYPQLDPGYSAQSVIGGRLYFSSFHQQADLSKQRVVSRERGEKLAKVRIGDFSWIMTWDNPMKRQTQYLVNFQIMKPCYVSDRTPILLP